jgi:hypothetical protein
MPATKLTDQQHAYRELVAAGAAHSQGALLVARRIGQGPYASDHPVHHAAVDCHALRCELHAIADAHPDEPRLRLVANVLDVAADDLDDYATAVGL